MCLFLLFLYGFSIVVLFFVNLSRVFSHIAWLDVPVSFLFFFLLFLFLEDYSSADFSVLSDVA